MMSSTVSVGDAGWDCQYKGGGNAGGLRGIDQERHQNDYPEAPEGCDSKNFFQKIKIFFEKGTNSADFF